MNSTITTQRHWFIVALVALGLGLLFVLPFLGVIVLAALFAFLFFPVYSWLGRRMRSGAAATVTVVVSGLVVLVPIVVVLILGVLQLSNLVADLAASFDDGSAEVLPQGIQDTITTVNAALAPIAGIDPIISGQGVVDFIRTTLPGVLKVLVASVTSIVGSIPIVTILAIMYVILMYEFLVYGKKINDIILKLSPFEPKVTKMYVARIGLMTNAMAKGQLLISLVISVLSALLLTVFLGLGEYFLLMVIVFTVLNLIPLGCGVLVIPITLIAMVTGMFWPGLIALVLYMAVANLDAVIRPRIIPKTITLSPGLTMLAAFGGITLFGLVGVVYGPIIMIVIVTSIEMYLQFDSVKKQKIA
jgi:predicted PurR-regulated permease PerM